MHLWVELFVCHVRVWLYEWEIIFVFAHFCTRAHAGVGKCLQYASGACAAKNSLSLTVLYMSQVYLVT